MTALEEWIDQKAATAAYKLSLRDLDAVAIAVGAMGRYVIETDAIKAIRANVLADCSNHVGMEKSAARELLQPLIDALKAGDPTSEAQAMRLD